MITQPIGSSESLLSRPARATRPPNTANTMTEPMNDNTGNHARVLSDLRTAQERLAISHEVWNRVMPPVSTMADPCCSRNRQLGRRAALDELRGRHGGDTRRVDRSRRFLHEGAEDRAWALVGELGPVPDARELHHRAVRQALGDRVAGRPGMDGLDLVYEEEGPRARSAPACGSWRPPGPRPRSRTRPGTSGRGCCRPGPAAPAPGAATRGADERDDLAALHRQQQPALTGPVPTGRAPDPRPVSKP